MTYNPFNQPYIRSGVHHIVATLLFTLYGMLVSPHMDAVPFINLFFQSSVFFLIVYILRVSLYLSGIKSSTLLDISMYTFLAILLAAWQHMFYGFPLESNLKVVFGIIFLGSLITIDLAITQARIEQNKPSSFSATPTTFIPLAIQVGFAIIYLLICLTMLLSLVMNKELIWISQHKSLSLELENINNLVKSYLAVALVISIYIFIIAKNAAVLFKRQLAYQAQALDKAIEHNFEYKVPMNTLGEFGIIAYFTNNMLIDLKQKNESELKENKKSKAKSSASKEPEPTVQTDYNQIQFGKSIIDDNSIIGNLAALISTRDGTSRAHLMRIQRYIKVLATSLSRTSKYKDYLTEETIQLIYQASTLYDIGRIAIPDKILNKNGKLTEEEFVLVKTHPQIGAEALRIKGSDNEFFKIASAMAGTHHEHWDGSGYPNALSKEDIPLVGRLMALVDVYDALISKTNYRAAFTHDVATEIIKENKGKQFDPDVVAAFLAIEEQFLEISRSYRDDLLYTLVN